jgi:hypothetical protein
MVYTYLPYDTTQTPKNVHITTLHGVTNHNPNKLNNTYYLLALYKDLNINLYTVLTPVSLSEQTHQSTKSEKTTVRTSNTTYMWLPLPPPPPPPPHTHTHKTVISEIIKTMLNAASKIRIILNKRKFNLQLYSKTWQSQSQNVATRRCWRSFKLLNEEQRVATPGSNVLSFTLSRLTVQLQIGLACFLVCVRRGHHSFEWTENYRRPEWEESKTVTSCVGIVKGRRWRSFVVESSWNVMAHGDAREGKWRGNWRIEWVARTLHTSS